MASAGTLLTDLHSSPPVLNQDEDLVNRILQDMNQTGSSANPVMNAPPPPMGQPHRPMIQSPNPNTAVYPMATDPATATAHLIGKEYPTPADFANMMHTPSYTNGAGAYGPAGPAGYSAAQMQPLPTLMGYDTMKGNFYSEVLSQIKLPLVVAIIIGLLSLPVINVLIGHYFPSFLRIGGDLTTAGLVIKAAVGGFLFWFIQKVLVPLMAI